MAGQCQDDADAHLIIVWTYSELWGFHTGFPARKPEHTASDDALSTLLVWRGTSIVKYNRGKDCKLS